MYNLQFCSAETKKRVEKVLNSIGTHFFTIDIIKQGLSKDKVDAVRDVELALEMLKLVMND